jgi:phosphatidate cytidylyltransferase
MLKRTLTALLLIPPVVYLIGWSPEWLYVLAVVVAVILALREYFALCRAMGFRVFSCTGYFGAVALCIAQTLRFHAGHAFALNHFAISLKVLVGFLLLVSTLALRPSVDLKDYLASVSVTVFGILYVGLALACLVPARFAAISGGTGVGPLPGDAPPLFELSFGGMLVLFMFLVIWAGDICAYLVGRPFGRTPFFARISPRKTWEGALAGLVGSVLAGWGFAHWIWKSAAVGTVILLAAWLAVAGQVGDLVESAIKRCANQKDSGTLLPGHGGFLDRIDSLLFAAPALWLAMTLLGYFP